MAKIDKILGSISPLYGQISGEGLFGGLTRSGMGGIIPQLIYNARQSDKKGKKTSSETEEVAMRRGGKVKKMAKGGSTASKRADGCATKGKTKGRFV
jgi:hypothetical protein